MSHIRRLFRAALRWLGLARPEWPKVVAVTWGPDTHWIGATKPPPYVRIESRQESASAAWVQRVLGSDDGKAWREIDAGQITMHRSYQDDGASLLECEWRA